MYIALMTMKNAVKIRLAFSGLKVSLGLSPVEASWLPEYFGLFQFELFIWNMMKQKQTPTCRNGTWPCWSWAATNTTSNDPSSCTFGKPLTSMYFYTPVHKFEGGGCKLLKLTLVSFSCGFIRYMMKHKSHLRFWAQIRVHPQKSHKSILQPSKAPFNSNRPNMQEDRRFWTSEQKYAFCLFVVLIFLKLPV